MTDASDTMLKFDPPEATRNRIAYAKVTDAPTGKECPEEQLADFAECAKPTIVQSVRWYHPRHENARVL